MPPTTAAMPLRRTAPLLAALSIALAGLGVWLAAAPQAQAAGAPAGSVAQLAGTAGCTSNTGTGGSCIDGEALDYARGVTVSPDGAHVYVASYTSDAIVVFSRDAGSGALTQTSCVHNTGAGSCTDATALNGVWDVAVSPDGSHLFAASVVDDSIAVFDRDEVSGALTQRSCISRTGHGGACIGDALLDDVRGVALSSDGAHVYGVSRIRDAALAYLFLPGPDTLVRVGCHSRTGSGGLCVAAPELDDPRGVALSADGTSAYVVSYVGDAVSAFARDAGSGVLAHRGCVSETGTGGSCVDSFALNGARGVAASADGEHVYVVSYISDALVEFDRDATTGALAHGDCISETGTGGLCTDGFALNGPAAVTVSPDGGYVYAGVLASDAVRSFERDAATGGLDPVACTARTTVGGSCAVGTALDGAWATAMSPDGQHLYATSYISDAVLAFDREFGPVCASIDTTATTAAPTAISLACTDADGDALTLALLSDPLNGSLSALDQAAMTVLYTSAASFQGADAFTFTASDGTNTASAADARILVAPPPAPVTPPPTSPPPAKAPASKRPRLSLALLPRTRAGGRIIRVRISCKAGPSFCAGRLVLKTDTRRAIRKGGLTKTVRKQLARKAFFLDPGTRQTINLRMKKRNARILFQAGDGSTRAIAYARNKDGVKRRIMRARTLVTPKTFSDQ